MSDSFRELPIPPAAEGDPKSGEMLRAWIANGGLHCSLNPNVWDNPGHWGILLADLARHVANATHESSAADKSATIERIRAAFAAELDAPTDEPSGNFLGE